MESCALKVSVIIPVYKVENYIEKCVKSVQAQTYQNIEILIIDDGSPDRAPEICDGLAQKDKRIRIVHKENGGLSDARNAGIKVATGDYVLFLDGDDFWDDSYAVERLINRVSKSNVDVLNFSYKKYYEDTKQEKSYFVFPQEMPVDCKSKTEQLNYLTQYHLYIASACNKMIRRSLLREKLLFEKGIFSEDIEWGIRLLYYAESFDFVCENFYCYRQRKDSIRHTISMKNCHDLRSNIEKCIAWCEKSPEEWRNSFYRYTAFQYATFFMVQAQADRYPKEDIKKLSQYEWVMGYHAGKRKIRYLHYAGKIFGYRGLTRLVRLIYGHSWR